MIQELARETAVHAPRAVPPSSGIETSLSSATPWRMAILFLAEETSLPGVAKVLVTKQVTPTLFTWCPSDTGVSVWKVKTGPAVLSPKPRPWRHHGAMAVTTRLVTADDTSVVRQIPIPSSFHGPSHSSAFLHRIIVAPPSRHNEARPPRHGAFCASGAPR